MKALTQNQISAACDALSDKIPEVLERLGIDDYEEHPNRYAFPCPIHGGDKEDGCTIYTDSESVVGNWQCWTGGCHHDHVNNIFGFVRACLGAKKGYPATLNETYEFCSGIKKPTSKRSNHDDIGNQCKLTDVFLKTSKKSEQSIDRDTIKKSLNIPSDYYLDRGFSKEVLETFDVGDCLDASKPMANRAVVPIYDGYGLYVACVGRSVNDKIKPKWLNSKGFKKDYLYGLNIAKEAIIKSRTAFILEGQGDVWRMHEAGYKNSISIFGSAINENQLVILEELGIMNLVVLTDYDDAGEKAAKQIIKKCGRRFNYIRPKLDTKDVGDMSVQSLQKELSLQI